MAPLTTAQREKLPDTAFGLPETREYPLDTKARARSALARASVHATPAEQRRIRAAVIERYPKMHVKTNPGRMSDWLVFSTAIQRSLPPGATMEQRSAAMREAGRLWRAGERSPEHAGAHRRHRRNPESPELLREVPKGWRQALPWVLGIGAVLWLLSHRSGGGTSSTDAAAQQRAALNPYAFPGSDPGNYAGSVHGTDRQGQFFGP